MIRLTFAATAFATLAASAHSQNQISIKYLAETASVSGSKRIEKEIVNEGGSVINASADASTGGAVATTYGYGNLRSLHAYAQTEMRDGPYMGGAHHASAYSTIRAHDEFTLFANGKDGEYGTMIVNVRLDGHASAHAAGFDPGKPDAYVHADYTWILSTAGKVWGSAPTSEHRYQGRWTATPSRPNGYGSNPDPQIRQIEIPILFGSTMVYDVTVSASTGIRDAQGSTSADFGHTYEWLGIASVLDDDGNLIQNYSMTSASGTDYVTAPVPEPATLAILGIGAIGLLRRRPRRD